MIRELKKLIRNVVRRVLAEEHNHHLPAQVVSYDAATNTCSVQPVINRFRLADPNNLHTVKLPQIDDVPVKQFGSGKLLLTVAPQTDSYGWSETADREIATWLMNGGIVDPANARSFDSTDCMFDPGLYTLKPDGDNGLIAVPVRTDRIEMRTRIGTSYVAVTDSGDIEIAALSVGLVTIAGDGTITIENSAGDIELASSGTVTINGNLQVLV